MMRLKHILIIHCCWNLAIDLTLQYTLTNYWDVQKWCEGSNWVSEEDEELTRTRNREGGGKNLRGKYIAKSHRCQLFFSKCKWQHCWEHKAYGEKGPKMKLENISDVCDETTMTYVILGKLLSLSLCSCFLTCKMGQQYLQFLWGINELMIKT